MSLNTMPSEPAIADSLQAPAIDDTERTRRKAAIDYARNSVRLEGFVLSADVEEINRRFIAGELTGDEHIAAIKAAVQHR
jgi:hypothetical protein